MAEIEMRHYFERPVEHRMTNDGSDRWTYQTVGEINTNSALVITKVKKPVTFEADDGAKLRVEFTKDGAFRVSYDRSTYFKHVSEPAGVFEFRDGDICRIMTVDVEVKDGD